MTAAAAQQKVLLYSRTAGFRHDSIPNAIAAIEKLGKKHNFETVSSEDPLKFEKKGWLKQFDALVFISVSGEALTKEGEVNMMKYIENGGGYFGIHEACDALYHSPWYGRLVGAYFNYHPYLQEFTMDVQSHDNPSTSFLNKTWSVTDEVYAFNSDPRKVGKQVVLTVNPDSYKDPGNSIKVLAAEEGAKHPIAWYKEGGLLDPPAHHLGEGMDDISSTPKNQRGTGGPGRAYYTALGHTKACWTNDVFLQHIQGALQWVLESPTIRSNNASLPSKAPGSSPPDKLTKIVAVPITHSSSSTHLHSTSSGSNVNVSETTSTDKIPLINGASNNLFPLLSGLLTSLSLLSLLALQLLS